MDLRFSCLKSQSFFSWVSVRIHVFLHFLLPDEILRFGAFGWGLTESGENSFLFKMGVDTIVGYDIAILGLLILADAESTYVLTQELNEVIFHWSPSDLVAVILQTALL